MTLADASGGRISADAFFSSLEAGQPRLPYCIRCEHFFFYPRTRCPRCHHRSVEYRRTGTFSLRTFTWVMRPQAPVFENAVPILMLVGESRGASLIAEGRGWTLDSPPRIGDPARLASYRGPVGTVAVFEPEGQA